MKYIMVIHYVEDIICKIVEANWAIVNLTENMNKGGRKVVSTIKVLGIMVKNKLFKLFHIRKKSDTLIGVLNKMYDDRIYPFLPRLVCRDGFSISVQYGEYFQRDIDSLELGFPSSEEILLDEYKDDDVYPYVPISLVSYIIERHGGIVKCVGLESAKKKNAHYKYSLPARS